MVQYERYQHAQLLSLELDVEVYETLFHMILHTLFSLPSFHNIDKLLS